MNGNGFLVLLATEGALLAQQVLQVVLVVALLAVDRVLARQNHRRFRSVLARNAQHLLRH